MSDLDVISTKCAGFEFASVVCQRPATPTSEPIVKAKFVGEDGTQLVSSVDTARGYGVAESEISKAEVAMALPAPSK